jgi:hypothetical protein|tara:strand:- start:279 stop:581 length:303 start_codon:yes stop_codon:yes gene_type:complete
MLIAVSIGTINKNLRKTKMMTDEQMLLLLDKVDEVMADSINEGNDVVEVASVIFAVAIKNLKLNLDNENFTAIIDEIRNTDIDDLIRIEYVKKEKDRTIH